MSDDIRVESDWFPLDLLLKAREREWRVEVDRLAANILEGWLDEQAPRLWTCDERALPGMHVEYPEPIIGYMQGATFLPAWLVDKLAAEHPIPPGYQLIPVRQAPIDGAAFTLSDTLIREAQSMSPEEAIAAGVARAREGRQ